jgi:hypothetical protein
MIILKSLLRKIQMLITKETASNAGVLNPQQAMDLSLALLRYGLSAYKNGFEDQEFDPRKVVTESVGAIHEIVKALGYSSVQEEVMKQCIGTQLLLASPNNTMH